MKLARKKNALWGRQRFKCVVCGLEIEGRESPDGTRIIPYDRAGYDGSPVRPFRCVDSALCHPGDKTTDAICATSAVGGVETETEGK